MPDFAHAGPVCTLPRLNETHLARVEADLAKLATERPIALVLPCHGRDLEGEAFANIIGELRDARFLRDIVVSVNAASRETFDALPARFAGHTARCRFLWNDRPDGGKGANVAAALTLLCAEAECAVIAMHDCDVASFQREDLARLCFAVAHPRLGYRFAKAYYSRVSDDRLFGRVTRLFLTPFLRAVARVAGPLPLVDFLLGFRYPLAGEVALTRELAASLPVANGWALEVAQLCEVFRRDGPEAVCQVEGGRGYRHKHQSASPALTRMTVEIAEEVFRQLATEGVAADCVFRKAVADVFRLETVPALRRSWSLAEMNALPFDLAAEQAITNLFAAELDCLAGASCTGAG